MMLDISVKAAKERAARFVSSWAPDFGLAGVERTRKDPCYLTDRQADFVDTLCRRVRGRRRSAELRAAVLRRLSGSVGTAAVVAACTAAAIEAGLAPEQVGLSSNPTCQRPRRTSHSRETFPLALPIL
jgi:hypothetical protein